MRRLIAIAAIAFAAASPALAQGTPPAKPDSVKPKPDSAQVKADSTKAKPASVIGSWVGMLTTPDGAQELTLTIRRDSTGYVGTIASSQGTIPIYDVKVEGEKIQFGSSVPTPSGNLELWYTFTVKDDAMNGQLEGSFNGQAFALPLSLKKTS